MPIPIVSMVSCAVINCPNRTNKDRDDSKRGVRFFNIPKVIVNQCSLTRSRTERRRSNWLSKINRKDLQDKDVKPYTRVCSEHFVAGNVQCYSVFLLPYATKVNLGFVVYVWPFVSSFY